MKINNVWLGLVELAPLEGNETLLDNSGAFVNVAYIADSEKEFIQIVKATFLENKLEVTKIEDIENIADFSVDKPKNAEKIGLLSDVVEGEYDYSWGVFHTFDDEEE